jgi:broad specificity phosphatase PhoE
VTTIELVRHAKAHSRDRWWGKPDRDRPLTPEGVDQARWLARDLLRGGPITALYSSPFTRCVQTLQPVSAGADLPIVAEEALGEAATLPLLDDESWSTPAWIAGRALALVERLLADHPEERVVACTHGDVVPALVALLLGRDGLLADQVRLKKGARFTLSFKSGRCVAVQHVPAPVERVRR